MQSFISETLENILSEHTSLEEAVFIFPSQRAGVFVKHTLKKKISRGFLPEISSIETFVECISGLSKVDALQLLFHFYTIYRKVEKHPEPFEVFSSWASTALQDFNEMDQHLIDANDILDSLRDLQRMKKWSVDGVFKETPLIKDHFIFMERLGIYYQELYSFLLDKQLGYQGLMYREAVKKTPSFLEKNRHKKFFFIGFNALNKAEESLFQAFLEEGNTEVYWDIDRYFYESSHSAGKFIRRYKNEWSYYRKNALKIVSDNFSTKKNIQTIGAVKNVAQLKYAGEILKSFDNHDKTVFVLGDESLLSVALSSIPENVGSVNITMGFPLQNLPASQLITAIFQLFLTQNTLPKSTKKQFYHKDVSRFFKNPLVLQLVPIEKQKKLLNTQITMVRENNSMLNLARLHPLIALFDKQIRTLLLSIFSPILSVDEFIDRILKLFEKMTDHVSGLEKESLFRLHSALTQLQILDRGKNYFKNIKTLYEFYKTVLVNEKLSFQGAPLEGLQLMGLLETRGLDFENVLISSVNEQVIPSNSTLNSLIPFDIKVTFGLPTYKEKDAIYSHHFFRLLQRAKNIYLLYNTENDAFGNGEKSRFIAQLEMIRKELSATFVAPKVITEQKERIKIDKNSNLLERLKKLAEKGISPSAITNYLYNPIAFYKQKVLGIGQLVAVEETVASNTLGTIVHQTLEALYRPYVNQFLTTQHLDLMLQRFQKLVTESFAKQFKNGVIDTGKNRLAFEVTNQFVRRFLTNERNGLSKHRIKILGIEIPLEASITVSGIDFPIKIKGIVDRVDEFDGQVRIIDYKTGKVNPSELKILNFEEIPTVKHSKAVQLLLYAYLYSQAQPQKQHRPLQAGMISFKNLKKGILRVNFSNKTSRPDYEIDSEKLEKFIHQIKNVLREIYSPSVPFQEPKSLSFKA